ncbi:MAG: HAD-IA family hydrolase [Magnetococcales bacterium]|nr:HAD-IA family hydrolase [Magnetococcales bacterium]
MAAIARFDTVIFDCDGTLVDSHSGITSSMCMAFEAMAPRHSAFARPPTGGEVSGIIGLSLEQAISTLVPELPREIILEAVAAYKEAFRTLGDAGRLGDGLYPGVRETLEALRDGGVNLTVATGKSRMGLGRTLRDHDLGDFFTILKTSDCAPSKPHPGMVLQTLDETGCDPVRCLMVGDTDFDMEMARGAGVKRCAVTFGYHSRERLARAKPDYWVDAMPELVQIVLAED